MVQICVCIYIVSSGHFCNEVTEDRIFARYIPNTQHPAMHKTMSTEDDVDQNWRRLAEIANSKTLTAEEQSKLEKIAAELIIL